MASPIQSSRFSLATTLYAALTGGLTWIAVVLQFHITTNKAIEDGLGFWIGATRYFGYFTVLTNLLVAIALTVPLIVPWHRISSFLTHPSTRTAIAGYIIMVGVAYYLLLKNVWNPQGLQLFVHHLLHSVIPIAYVMFWAMFVPKTRLQWRDLLVWLIYPLIYLAIALMRGALFNWYPYPFLEVDKLGYPEVLWNSLELLLGFAVVSLGLIGIGRLAGYWLKQNQ
ncbi:MAG: Pr6Pr family membrane protein [Synechococcales cyanobacterium T60_A2020_003]|nr:Pr6Pr family membrane protein [Synechococcales cyanobacterium T60_A2020_003]